jgi:hypothetical protein
LAVTTTTGTFGRISATRGRMRSCLTWHLMVKKKTFDQHDQRFWIFCNVPDSFHIPTATSLVRPGVYPECSKPKRGCVLRSVVQGETFTQRAVATRLVVRSVTLSSLRRISLKAIPLAFRSDRIVDEKAGWETYISRTEEGPLSRSFSSTRSLFFTQFHPSQLSL